MIKRLGIVLLVVITPFIIGLLFIYDIIKIDWVSMMEIQPSYKAQSAPLPLPKDSIPVEGPAYIAGLGSPVNPVPADQVSLTRGAELYAINCTICHGDKADGKGKIAGFLQPNKPANLLEGNAKNSSDGAIFMVISDGIIGSMPALRENLTVRDRWDVVNYVRSLQK
jgi:mono/diheme cytochrome c family protein